MSNSKLLALAAIALTVCAVPFGISQRAAAVTMVYIGASDSQPGTCDAKGDCSLTVPLGGYSTPGGNPNDYGMCGIVGLYGNYGRAKVARIIIVGDRYAGNLQWTGGGVIPPIELELTCAFLKEFTGLPAASKFAINQPPPVASSASPKQIAGKPDACIWTGIELGPSPGAAPTFDVSTQAQSGGDKTIAAAQTLTGSISTYAFCNSFAGKTTAWKYRRIGPFTASPTVSAPAILPGTAKSKYWCFLVGVQGDEVVATPGFHANLQTDALSPHDYQYDVNSQGLYWNCLQFAQ